MLGDISKNTVAVCVTGQMDCDKLINAGRELADSVDAALVVMSALPRLYDVQTAQVLEYLYSCSTQAGAQMLVMYTDHPMDALIDGFKKQNVGHVLLGAPRDHSSQMGARLMYAYPNVKYYALDPQGKACLVQRAVRPAL